MEIEIDMKNSFKALNNRIGRLRFWCLNLVNTFFKYWWITIPILLLSCALGYYLDSIQDSEKEATIVVNQNFESVNYLYESIEKLNSKIISNDTVFLSSIGLKGLKKIEIEPIINLQAILNGTDLSTRNLETVFNEVPIDKENKYATTLNSEAFLANYNKHKIYIKASDKTCEMIYMNLMNYLNSNSHFQDIKKQNLLGLDTDLFYNKGMIDQIDSILRRVQTYNNNDGLLIPQSDSDLNNLLLTKKDLVKQNKMINIQKINWKEVIYSINKPSFSKVTKSIFSKRIILLPLLFLPIFFLWYSFKSKN